MVFNIANNLSKIYSKIKIVLGKDYNLSKQQQLIGELEQSKCQIVIDDIVNHLTIDNYTYANKDIVILMTENNEDNILKSLLLKYHNTKNVMCFLSDSKYEKFLSYYGISNMIIYEYFIINNLLNYFRSGVIINAYSLYKKIEIIEYHISDNSYFLGKSIFAIEEKRNIVVVAVVDENELMLVLEKNLTIKLNYKLVIAGLRKDIQKIDNIIFGNYASKL